MTKTVKGIVFGIALMFALPAATAIADTKWSVSVGYRSHYTPQQQTFHYYQPPVIYHQPPVVVYRQPPVYYYSPPPVVYYNPPIYRYPPSIVYYQPQPQVFIPPPYYYRQNEYNRVEYNFYWGIRR